MGTLKDLGTGFVEDVCIKTGYPRDWQGHLLNPYNPRNSQLERGWHEKGTQLFRLTNPYGLLEFAIGSGEEFWCFDYAIIQKTTSTGWIVLHAVLNSETGGHIETVEYNIIHNHEWDHQSINLILQALEWCDENDIRHDEKGWNQDPYHFHRDLYVEDMRIFGEQGEAPMFTDMEFRFGGKDINTYTGLTQIFGI